MAAKVFYHLLPFYCDAKCHASILYAIFDSHFKTMSCYSSAYERMSLDFHSKMLRKMYGNLCIAAWKKIFFRLRGFILWIIWSRKAFNSLQCFIQSSGFYFWSFSHKRFWLNASLLYPTIAQNFPWSNPCISGQRKNVSFFDYVLVSRSISSSEICFKGFVLN